MINQKVVFITGSAGNLGSAFVDKFTKAGYQVFATARKIPADIAKNTSICWHSLDISEYDQCKEAVTTCMRKYGRIDVLINNASSCIGGKSIGEFTQKEIDTEVDVTFKGAVYLTQLFVSQMSQYKYGKIFFISSISGLPNESGNSYHSLYGGLKAGIIRFSESVNQDISQYNMQSHVVVPCNIRHENLLQEKAVSFKDIAKAVLQMTNMEDNLSFSQVILRPALQNNKG